MSAGFEASKDKQSVSEERDEDKGKLVATVSCATGALDTRVSPCLKTGAVGDEIRF
jgi:hypothetical protein